MLTLVFLGLRSPSTATTVRPLRAARKSSSSARRSRETTLKCILPNTTKVRNLLFGVHVRTLELLMILSRSSPSAGEQIIAKGEFTSNDVHKQYGICLRTPPYADKDVHEPVLCSMYLYRPKNKAKSEPVDFTFYPTTNARSAADAMFAAPAPAQQMAPTAKISNKRTRAKAAMQSNQQQHDDPSSGQVNVPPKNSMVSSPTGTGGFRSTAGGSVTIVQDPHHQQQDLQMGNYRVVPQQPGLGRSTDQS